MAEQGQVLNGLFPSVSSWPWTWVRMTLLVKRVRNVYERVGLDPDPETAVPARWMFWDNKALDKWFDERSEGSNKDD